MLLTVRITYMILIKYFVRNHTETSQLTTALAEWLVPLWYQTDRSQFRDINVLIRNTFIVCGRFEPSPPPFYWHPLHGHPPPPPLFIFFFPKPRFWIDVSDNIAPVKYRISTKINSCSKVIYSIDNPFLQENLDTPFPLLWFFKNTNPSINKWWVREGHTMTLHCNFISIKTSFAEAGVKNVSMKL